MARKSPCLRAEAEAGRRIQKSIVRMQAVAGAAAGQDPHAIHQLRVASRRARAALAEFRGQFAPGPWKRLQLRVREATQSLGRARELDVTLALLDAWEHLEPSSRASLDYARERLREERKLAAKNVADAARDIASPSFGETTIALFQGYRPVTRCFLTHSEDRLGKHLKQVEKRYAAWKKSGNSADLHRLRIQFKKFRYALEHYVRLYDESAKRSLKDLKSAQESIGLWNDHCVLAHYLLAYIEEAPDEFNAGLQTILGEVEARESILLHDIKNDAANFFKKPNLKKYRRLFSSHTVECCEHGSNRQPGQEASTSIEDIVLASEEPAP